MSITLFSSVPNPHPLIDTSFAIIISELDCLSFVCAFFISSFRDIEYSALNPVRKMSFFIFLISSMIFVVGFSVMLMLFFSVEIFSSVLSAVKSDTEAV